MTKHLSACSSFTSWFNKYHTSLQIWPWLYSKTITATAALLLQGWTRISAWSLQIRDSRQNCTTRSMNLWAGGSQETPFVPVRGLWMRNVALLPINSSLAIQHCSDIFSKETACVIALLLQSVTELLPGRRTWAWEASKPAPALVSKLSPQRAVSTLAIAPTSWHNTQTLLTPFFCHQTGLVLRGLSTKTLQCTLCSSQAESVSWSQFK